MKKTLSFLMLLLSLGAGSCTKETTNSEETVSGFDPGLVDDTLLDNFDVLGRVWGYVKYHHPAMSSSAIDIDQELFALLPRVAHVAPGERNRILLEWIGGFGKYDTVSEDIYTAQYKGKCRRVTLSEWITDERLGRQLAEELRRMRLARRTLNRYVWIDDVFQKFTNESTDGSLDDCKYRLLLLYRFWNALEYYNPNRNLTDRDWDRVLPDFLPEFIKTQDMEQILKAFVRLNAMICDGHSSGHEYMLTGLRMVPVGVRYIDGRLIVTKPGLFAAGDEVTNIDGVSPKTFFEGFRPFISASNESAAAFYASMLAVSTKKETIGISCLHDGKEVSKQVSTSSYEDYYASFVFPAGDYRLLNSSVGYLCADAYTHAEAEQIMEMFRDTKAIIVDMRYYPKEFMVFDFVGRYFVNGPVASAVFEQFVPNLPGMVYSESNELGSSSNSLYKGRVIVLVDVSTQSNMEYTTMAFQPGPRCTVVGSQTAGADGNVTTVPMPHGLKVVFSGLGVSYPDRTNTQRAGVRVDVEVHPTVEGIRAGRDEVLEKALQIAANE